MVRDPKRSPKRSPKEIHSSRSKISDLGLIILTIQEPRLLTIPLLGVDREVR